ncbi:MAG: SusD/RagB family nutrient-binding outer membrane lipoprotein [Saprospiraceae bacterium]|nr:SusD/RagB family nutrient-binding outer membrane lipoprotein [Saprospiraceae bacterium]
MKQILYKFLIVLGVFTISSCEFDLLDSPNDVTLASTDVNLLLNRIQVTFADFFNGISDRGCRVTRIYHQSGDTYQVAYPAIGLNGSWSVYSGTLRDIQAVKQAAPANFKRHLGIVKVLEAYILMALVDNFGDIPYSQAFDPNEFNPGRDKDSDVYKAAFDLLESAKADLTDANFLGTPPDFFYNRDYNKWVRLANTLQLKYHLNRRLIDKAGSTAAINALIAGNTLLRAGDDFIFRYGKNVVDPATRHPRYVAQHPNGGGDYQSNYFMWHLTDAKGFEDVRRHFYFFRQASAPGNQAQMRCVDEFPPQHYPVGMVFCYPNTRGFWGRDHLDPQGIPPDNLLRTLYGVYPAGGTFDDNTPRGTSATNLGAGGAGIEPIMLAAFVDFMLAEAALTLGTTGNPKDYLNSAITKHMNFVRSWSVTTDEANRINAFMDMAAFNTRRDAYLAYVASQYDAAANDAAKMRIIALEYWIACYGSGLEAYNLYRRTGQPNGMQPGLDPNFGKFPRTFLYPSNHVERNNRAPQKGLNEVVKVFWDNNPDNFIF